MLPEICRQHSLTDCLTYLFSTRSLFFSILWVWYSWFWAPIVSPGCVCVLATSLTYIYLFASCHLPATCVEIQPQNARIILHIPHQTHGGASSIVSTFTILLLLCLLLRFPLHLRGQAAVLKIIIESHADVGEVRELEQRLFHSYCCCSYFWNVANGFASHFVEDDDLLFSIFCHFVVLYCSFIVLCKVY